MVGLKIEGWFESLFKKSSPDLLLYSVQLPQEKITKQRGSGLRDIRHG